MNKRFFSLIATIMIIAGCASSNKVIYVDGDNKTGPWDGSDKHPYQTIAAGIKAAKTDSGDIVSVRDGNYPESVVVKPGVTLRQAIGEQKPTSIIGKPGAPAIVAGDRSAVEGFTVAGGSVGVLVKLKATIGSQESRSTSVAHTRFEGTHGIRVETPSNLAFGKGVRRTPKLEITQNYFLGGTGGTGGGNAIQVDLLGPKTGELSIVLNIADNVIQDKSTGIDLTAKGKGPNPSGIIRAQFTGVVMNNLILDGYTGIRLTSENQGAASLTVMNNTIAYNDSHAIVADAVAGPDGGSSNHPKIVNNIVVGNKGYGYVELNKKTSAQTLANNLFYQNGSGHYFDQETVKNINSQIGLNTPIVGNKIVFINGSGNLVANPQFAKGGFSWNGKNWGNEKAGGYFLTQGGTKKSPAVDSGLGSATQAGLQIQSTSTDFSYDKGKVDIGFHYRKPWKK